MSNKSILIIEDDEFSAENIKLSLRKFDYDFTFGVTAVEAITAINNKRIDIAIIDLKLPGDDGLTIIEKTKDDYPEIKYLLITGYSEEASIIRALKAGVDDILKKPYQQSELITSVEKLIHLQDVERQNSEYRQILEKENAVLKRQIERNFENDKYLIVGNSPAINSVLENARLVADHSVDTLICGESGTGKELLARFIHHTGPRFEKAFVPVNCPALTPSLFESELFGHEKGAFTNASSSRAGLFETANCGILFLDEVTEINIDQQAKLLRVVEEKKVQRVGSSAYKDVDVQILCSTNRDIRKLVSEGLFREDLYHRLAGTAIEIPPLRERTEDIEILTKHFLEKYSREFDKPVEPVSPGLMKILLENKWDGNIRQLSNFIRNWTLFNKIKTGTEIDKWLESGKLNLGNRDSFQFVNLEFRELEEAKKWMVLKVLRKYGGNKTKAAEHLGLSYAGLLKMLKGFG